MAGFELARIGSVGGMAREMRYWRHAPLYLAGIALGVGAGLGIGFLNQSHVALEPYTAPPANLNAPLTIPAIPEVIPAAPRAEIPIAAAPELPESFIALFTPPAEIAVAPDPVVQPPAAPQAAAPAPARPLAAAPPPLAAAPVQPVAEAPAPPAANPPVVEAPPAAAPAVDAKPNFYVPQVSGGGATDLEVRLLDGINNERAKAGLAPYAYDSGLTKIARTRSQQLIDQDYFGHRDPYGYSMYVELLAYFGYNSYAWAGENLAMNNYGAGESPERALVALMNSPTHRANILASDFSRIGIGEISTADGRHFFSMIFLG